MKMKIVFDEEKVRREGKYNVDEMQDSIDMSFADLEIPKIDRGVYQAQGKSKDFSHFLGICMGLRKVEWFMKYIDTWIWEKNNSFEDVKKEIIRCDKIYGRL